MSAEIDTFRTLVLELTETEGGGVSFVTEEALEERLKRHTEEMKIEMRGMIDTSLMPLNARIDRMLSNVERLAGAAMTIADRTAEQMDAMVSQLSKLDERGEERHKETVYRLEKMSAEVASWTAFRRTAVTFAQLVAALPVADFLKKLVAGLARLIGWLSVIGGSLAFGALVGVVFVNLVKLVTGG